MQRKFSLIRLGFSGFLFSRQLRCFPEQPSFTWQKPGCFSFLAMTLPAGYVASHCRPPELRKTCSTRLPTCTLAPGTTQGHLALNQPGPWQTPCIWHLSLCTWHLAFGSLHMTLGVGHHSKLNLGTWHCGLPCIDGRKR